MESNTLHIRNMYCQHCIVAVRNILKDEQIEFDSVKLGKAVVNQKLAPLQISRLEQRLKTEGFVLLRKEDQQLIDEVKSAVRERIHLSGDLPENFSFSGFLSKKLKTDYKHLSAVFSTKEGMTPGQYVIRQKVEKVKELISYKELTLSEISTKMGYSSVQYLSSQFKKVTGMSPSSFIKQKKLKRNPLNLLT